MHKKLGILCLILMVVHSNALSQSTPNAESNPKAEQSQSTKASVNKYGTAKPENPVFDPDARRAQRLADDLKSPFCPGKTLKTCTSPNAAKVRRDIQEMVLQGMSDEAIVASLQSSYDTNEFSVANPEQPAYTIFVPFIPFVILTGAMIFMIWLMRRRNLKHAPKAAEIPEDNESQAASRSALRARLQADDREG